MRRSFIFHEDIKKRSYGLLHKDHIKHFVELFMSKLKVTECLTCDMPHSPIVLSLNKTHGKQYKTETVSEGWLFKNIKTKIVKRFWKRHRWNVGQKNIPILQREVGGANSQQCSSGLTGGGGTKMIVRGWVHHPLLVWLQISGCCCYLVCCNFLSFWWTSNFRRKN